MLLMWVCLRLLLFAELELWVCLRIEVAGGLRVGGRLAAQVWRGRQGRFHALQAGLAPAEPLYTQQQLH